MCKMLVISMLQMSGFLLLRLLLTILKSGQEGQCGSRETVAAKHEGRFLTLVFGQDIAESARDAVLHQMFPGLWFLESFH
jgi:hypothetical protein